MNLNDLREGLNCVIGMLLREYGYPSSAVGRAVRVYYLEAAGLVHAEICVLVPGPNARIEFTDAFDPRDTLPEAFVRKICDRLRLELPQPVSSNPVCEHCLTEHAPA